MVEGTESVQTSDNANEDLSSRLIGRSLGGFEVLSYIGGGGMSHVFKARQISLNRTVAIKVLRKDMVDEETLQRLRREAVVLTKIVHPNIVNVYAFENNGDKCFLSMDFVDGKSLAQTLTEGGALPIDAAIHIATRAADALGYAHGKGIVHRDLKPSNIILVKDGTGWTPRLIDFGLAKVQTDSVMAKLTSTNKLMGTPGYMSPEQCNSAECDARSDVYSFGCVLYEMLSGEAPFIGDSAYAVLYQHLNTPAPELPAGRFPQWLRSVVARCLEKDPTKRFQSMQSLADALTNSSAQKILLQQKGLRNPSAQGWGKPSVVLGCLAIASLLMALVCYCYQQVEPDRLDVADALTNQIDKLDLKSTAAKRCRLLLQRAVVYQRRSRATWNPQESRRLQILMVHDLDEALQVAIKAGDEHSLEDCEKNIERDVVTQSVPDKIVENANLREDLLFDRSVLATHLLAEGQQAAGEDQARIIVDRLKAIMEKKGELSPSQVSKAVDTFRQLIDTEDSLHERDKIEPDVKLWCEFVRKYAPDTLAEAEALRYWVQSEYLLHGRFNDTALLTRVCDLLKHPTVNSEGYRATQINLFCVWTTGIGKGAVTLPLLLDALECERRSLKEDAVTESESDEKAMSDTLTLLSRTFVSSDPNRALKYADSAIEMQKRYLASLDEQIAVEVARESALIAKKNDDRSVQRGFNRCIGLMEQLPDKDSRANNVAMMYQYLADYYHSRARYQDEIDLIKGYLPVEQSKFGRQTTAFFNFIAQGYMGLKQYDNAAVWSRKAEELWDSPNHEPFTFRTVNTDETLCAAYLGLKKPELAAAAMDHAVKVLDQSLDLDPVERQKLREQYRKNAAAFRSMAKQ